MQTYNKKEEMSIRKKDDLNRFLTKEMRESLMKKLNLTPASLYYIAAGKSKKRTDLYEEIIDAILETRTEEVARLRRINEKMEIIQNLQP